MVHLPHLGKLRREVKEEAADEAAAAAPFHNNKRCRLGRQLQQQQGWCADGGVASQQHLQHDFLDEPSPLGLRLKKSPSLVDLIQMKLAQSGKAKDTQPCGNPGALEKLKASNFPASLLRIGDWEWISRYEGDLVAKCYFAKHKLVWEVLDGGLKSKIEIQWSDICALKVPCPENEPGTLEIALSRQPLFFRETNPQPRKHTLWQATSDFTGGQASIHRRHFLQCPTGMMNKHIEKLVRCDPRLYSLSQQNGIDLENPYFETRCSIFEDPEECQDFDFKDDDCQLEPLGFQKLSVPHSASGRTNAEATQHAGTPDGLPRYLMSSVPEMHVIKEGGASSACKLQANFFDWSGFKVPGIRHSMCKSEIVNHIGHHIYKQIYPGNLPGDCGDSTVNRQTFDELTRYLLNDSQITDATDEKMIMSRVNSLCCLLQRGFELLGPYKPCRVQ